MSKRKVGILGATGAVGQKYIKLLENHPWFQVAAVGASSRSAGKPYRKAVHWIEDSDPPAEIGDLEVAPCEPRAFNGVDFVFSGLDSSAAEQVEQDFVASGFPVISNASSYRAHPRVPLLVPEVNPDHIHLISHQRFSENGGFIVTNPNCVSIPLALALKPLHERYGVESVLMTSMQAISGGGYPGVSSMDITANIIPYISGEEDKIAREPGKILGKLDGEQITHAPFAIEASAMRVPVVDGHTLSVTLKLTDAPADTGTMARTFADWQSPIASHTLPSAPLQPLYLYDNAAHPQPRLHAGAENGMQVGIGRLRRSSIMDFSFIVLGHNTVRGAAGGSILNAELLAAENMLPGG